MLAALSRGPPKKLAKPIMELSKGMEQSLGHQFQKRKAREYVCVLLAVVCTVDLAEARVIWEKVISIKKMPYKNSLEMLEIKSRDPYPQIQGSPMGYTFLEYIDCVTNSTTFAGS
ncbi:hypothetical protein STEG23_037897, partial [Scotinomys teguina]